MTSLSLLVVGQKVGGGLEKVHFEEKEILVDEFFFFRCTVQHVES